MVATKLGKIVQLFKISVNDLVDIFNEGFEINCLMYN